MRKFLEAIDRRDVLALIGLCSLVFGLESVHPGVGFAAGGAVLIAIAVLVR